jgi:hypothetical protein
MLNEESGLHRAADFKTLNGGSLKFAFSVVRLIVD